MDKLIIKKYTLKYDYFYLYSKSHYIHIENFLFFFSQSETFAVLEYKIVTTPCILLDDVYKLRNTKIKKKMMT